MAHPSLGQARNRPLYVYCGSRIHGPLLRQPTGKVDQTTTRRAKDPPFQTVGIYSDSTAAIAIAKHTSTRGKSKHFDIKLRKVRELVEHTTIDITFRKTISPTSSPNNNRRRRATLRRGFDGPMSSPDPNVKAPNTPAVETSNYSDAPET